MDHFLNIQLPVRHLDVQGFETVILGRFKRKSGSVE